MLKKLPYIRHILILVVYIIMWIPNFLIAPILWMLGVVNKVRKNKTFFLVWFTNNDEPDDTQNNYGDDKYRKERGIYDIEDRNVFERFIWYVKWNVFRNSYFYFKLNVITPKVPKEGEPIVLKVYKNTVFGPNATRRQNLHICEKTDEGIIHCIERRGDTHYFRYSFTKEIKILWLFKMMWNVQLGANDTGDIWGNTDNTNRYLFKSKFFKRF